MRSSIYLVVLFALTMSSCASSSQSSLSKDALTSASIGERSPTELEKGLDSQKNIIYELWGNFAKTEAVGEGYIIFAFIINSDGSVSDVEVKESSFNSEPFINSSVELLKELKFESGEAEATEVVYRMNFGNE